MYNLCLKDLEESEAQI